MMTTKRTILMSRIEDLWARLRSTAGGPTQIRIDEKHPLDLYADFEGPDRVGLVAVCGRRPPQVGELRVLSVEEAKRSDGRWTLRLLLLRPSLAPVFSALCTDIVACTRSGVSEAALGQVVVKRLAHWRNLLERDSSGLDEAVLRGLIGELMVLRTKVLPMFPAVDAIRSWRGPSGAPQDFLFPDGSRTEVKTVGHLADQVRINGLAQLDASAGHLTLAVVRAAPTGPGDPHAVSAPALVALVREQLGDDVDALDAFEAALRQVGWHEHTSHADLVLRIMGIDEHLVNETFPRLSPANVPEGVMDADYIIALPQWHTSTGAAS
jgi:hypothetical protein